MTKQEYDELHEQFDRTIEAVRTGDLLLAPGAAAAVYPGHAVLTDPAFVRYIRVLDAADAYGQLMAETGYGKRLDG